MRKPNLSEQLEQLNDRLEKLHRPITMINVLHNRTDLDQLEISEIQSILSGIEDLLLHHLLNAQERITFIEKMEVANV